MVFGSTAILNDLFMKCCRKAAFHLLEAMILIPASDFTLFNLSWSTHSQTSFVKAKAFAANVVW